MKITQEELIEMICEGVNRKVHSLISENKKTRLTGSEMIRMVEQAILEYMFTDGNNLFGSDEYEVDNEYMAIDNDTLEAIVKECGWLVSDVHVLQSKTGQKATRFELEYAATPAGREGWGFQRSTPQQLTQELKQRAMYPNGVRVIKTSQGTYAIVVYSYKNE